MTDRGKSKHHHDWRKKEFNLSSLKYTKQQILALFRQTDPPSNFSAPLELLTNSSLSPSLSNISVIPCVSSHKPVKTKEPMPEWYTEEDSLSKKNINIDEIEDKYSKIDVEYENQLKKTIEEDEKVPDWDDPNEELYSTQIISYPFSLVSSHAKDGNPFACIIINHSTVDDVYITPDPYSIPFEKVWYYKDPQNNVRGPFSTIEMFNWSASGYFSTNLQLAHSSPTHFFYCLSFQKRLIGKFW